jgi:hypothetical protein
VNEALRLINGSPVRQRDDHADAIWRWLIV